MSFLSQQNPACNHDIFTFLPRCCHRKKILEYKFCPIKHRWSQALTRTYFPFQPFPSCSQGSRTRLSPCFCTVLITPHTYRLERDNWHCKERLPSPSRAKLTQGWPQKLPGPQGSENVPAVYDKEGVNRGAIPQCLRWTKSKVQLCHLPCAGSAACAAQWADLTANKSLSVSSVSRITVCFSCRTQTRGSNEARHSTKPGLHDLYFPQNCTGSAPSTSFWEWSVVLTDHSISTHGQNSTYTLATSN